MGERGEGERTRERIKELDIERDGREGGEEGWVRERGRGR